MLTAAVEGGVPVELDARYRFFEYACHEDNSAVRNFIETSRYEAAIRRTHGAEETLLSPSDLP